MIPANKDKIVKIEQAFYGGQTMLKLTLKNEVGGTYGADYTPEEYGLMMAERALIEKLDDTQMHLFEQYQAYLQFCDYHKKMEFDEKLKFQLEKQKCELTGKPFTPK